MKVEGDRARLAQEIHARFPAAGQARTDYKGLLDVRRRYITKDQLRAAIREVVNAIFRGTAGAHLVKEHWLLSAE